MSGIADFVAARLDEWEASARDAAAASGYVDRRPIPEWTTSGHDIVAGGVIASGVQGALDPPVAWHIATWDPARVLAEVALWRSPIEDYRVVMANNAIEKANGAAAVETGIRDLITKTLWMMLRRRATTWSDHSDFKPEWRIDG